MSKELPGKGATTKRLPVSLPPVRHDPIVTEHDSATDPDTVNARYRAYVMEKYDDLFEELEFRSQRAAMMHYHEANNYSRKCYYMELTAAILGAASVSGIGAFLLKWSGSGEGGNYCSASSSSYSRMGMFGVFGVVVASLIEFASKGSSRVIPTFCKRCEGHKKAAVGWQKLTRLTRSYRIQLRNPRLSVEDYMVWYAHLIRQRELVSSIQLVPSSTYRAFNDPGRVFAALRRKREMFLKYQEMFEGTLEVDDNYDDD